MRESKCEDGVFLLCRLLKVRHARDLRTEGKGGGCTYVRDDDEGDGDDDDIWNVCRRRRLSSSSSFLAVSPKRGTAIGMANPEKNVYQDNGLRTLTDFDE